MQYIFFRKRLDYVRAALRRLPRRGALAWLDRTRGKEVLDAILQAGSETVTLADEIRISEAL